MSTLSRSFHNSAEPHKSSAFRDMNVFRKMASSLAGVLIFAALMTITFGAPTGASTLAAKHAIAGRERASAQGTVRIVHGPPTFDDSTSSNWSGYNLGYLSTNTMYTSISGTWTVPKATPHKAGQAEHGATWIGIGGGCLNTSCTETDSTLIQAGTEQDVSKSGKASYSAWYELIPQTSVTEDITVNPGDVINCSITSTSDGEWTIVLTDTTNGQSFTESTAYSSSELTAEWIVETPVVVGTGGTGVAKLPRLGDVHFTNAEVNGANAALAPVDALQLINSKSKPISTPSNPNSKGNSFYVCTWASTCKA
jgi:hypothetical protein